PLNSCSESACAVTMIGAHKKTAINNERRRKRLCSIANGLFMVESIVNLNDSASKMIDRALWPFGRKWVMLRG
ncbi:MAG: hypothetical protein WA634_11480, partial [Silvibacterium sp.]